MAIQTLEYRHITGLQRLINAHLGAIVPGWSMSLPYIERHLQVNPYQRIIDPWVAERRTLIALERGRVVGAAHLLRYDTQPVSDDYQGAVDIAWLLFMDRYQALASDLLAACHEQAHDWEARHLFAFDSQLPITIYGGIPDVWRHVQLLFEANGYKSTQGGAIFGGTVDRIPVLPSSTLPARLQIQREVGGLHGGVRFAARLDGQPVGFTEWDVDLSRGGDLPALQGWAELSEIYVESGWRNRGIGTAIIQHSLPWLQMAHCDRVILCMDARDEAEGAGRFYQRMGWQPFARFHDGWIAPSL